MHILRLIKEKFSSALGKDIGITLASQIAIMILALVVNKLLSVMLGVEGYGQYSIIKKSTQVLSFVMLSGMGIALPRYFSGFIAQKDYVGAKSTVASSLLVTITVSLIVTTLCLVFFRQLSPLLTGGSDHRLYIAAILFALSLTFSSLLFAYYRGADAFKNFGVSQIAIQLIITISTIFWGRDLLQVLIIWSGATLIYVIISIIIESGKNKLYKENRVTRNKDIIPQLKKMTKYGMPRMLGDFFLFSFAAFPLIYISRKTGLTESSYFATGITLTSLITPFFAFTGMVLLPYVSRAKAENNFTAADKLVKQLSIGYIILSLAAITVLWFGIELFIKIFFSSGFLPSINVSRIIILSILFESIYLLLRNPIDAVSNFPYNTVNLFVCIVVMVVMFSFCSNLEQYAWVFFGVTGLKGALSWVVWSRIKPSLRSSQ